MSLCKDAVPHLTRSTPSFIRTSVSSRSHSAPCGITHYYHCLVRCPHFLRFDQWEPLQDAFDFFDTCPSLFECFLAFWHKIFQANVVLSLFQLCNRLFLQEPWFLRSQDLRAKCAQGYWRVTALRPSQWAGYICTHVLIYTLTSIIISLSLY